MPRWRVITRTRHAATSNIACGSGQRAPTFICWPAALPAKAARLKSPSATCAAQQLRGDATPDIALEWAELNAASGNLGEVEEFLQRQAANIQSNAPLIWEAVAEGYIRVYRLFDALNCLEMWLAVAPDNVRAVELRGRAFQNGQQTRKAAEDYRHVLQMDPERPATRWGLVLCLLDSGGYEEALPLLERIDRERPDDPDVKVNLARCHSMMARPDLARQILDAVLERHPDHALSLRTARPICPGRRRAGARRTLAAAGHGSYARRLPKSIFALPGVAAAEQIGGASAAKDRGGDERAGRRLGELQSRKLFEQPLNPALHYEMGVLLLHGGHVKAGEGWLLSAVHLKPDYQPAHAALAEFYERQGDPARAAEHRQKAKP